MAKLTPRFKPHISTVVSKQGAGWKRACTGSARTRHGEHPSSVLKSSDIFLFLMYCSVWKNSSQAALHLSLRQPINSNFREHVNMGCCVGSCWSRVRLHASGQEAKSGIFCLKTRCSVSWQLGLLRFPDTLEFMATIGVYWVEFFLSVKLRNGYVGLKMSPESSLTKRWEVNKLNFNIKWTIILIKFSQLDSCLKEPILLCGVIIWLIGII